MLSIDGREMSKDEGMWQFIRVNINNTLNSLDITYSLACYWYSIAGVSVTFFI